MIAELQTLLLAASLALLVGCANAQPMAYNSTLDNPEGPGLFTGESGVKTIPIDMPAKEERSEPEAQ
ncbi:MAG: hypothetical protein V7752_03880 [Halopseudomonas sp.]